MTRSKKYKSGIGIFRDSDKKRGWTPLPVSLTEFGERGRLLTKVKKALRRGPVLAAAPSNLLNAMAFCPAGEGEAWAAEIRAAPL